MLLHTARGTHHIIARIIFRLLSNDLLCGDDDDDDDKEDYIDDA